MIVPLFLGFLLLMTVVVVALVTRYLGGRAAFGRVVWTGPCGSFMSACWDILASLKTRLCVRRA